MSTHRLADALGRIMPGQIGHAGVTQAPEMPQSKAHVWANMPG